MRIRLFLSLLIALILFLLVSGSFTRLNAHAPTSTVAVTTPQLPSITSNNAAQVKQWHNLNRKHVTQISWSPDGKVFAAATWLDGVVLYDAQTVEPLPLQLINQDKRIRRVVFSPDGNFLLTATVDLLTDKPNLLELWNIETKKKTLTFREDSNTPYDGAAMSIAFSPSGALAATGEWGNVVYLWDVKTGLQTAVLKGHTMQVWTVTFSADGTLIASGSADSTVRLWSVNDQKEIALLQPSIENINSIALSPNNVFLAAGGQDGTIEVWNIKDVKNPVKLATLKGHENIVYGLTFNLDGSLLASASGDNTVRLWGMQKYQELAILRGHTDAVNTLAFSPNGVVLASGGDDGVILWEVSS